MDYMGMKDPLPTFTGFVERIRDAHPNFAYIHVIEDRANDTSDALRKIWGDLPSIAEVASNGPLQLAQWRNTAVWSPLVAISSRSDPFARLKLIQHWNFPSHQF